MENATETPNKIESTNNANSVSHYKLIAVGIFIGLIGVFLRFVTPWALMDMVSNIIFIIGTVICLKAVFNILK